MRKVTVVLAIIIGLALIIGPAMAATGKIPSADNLKRKAGIVIGIFYNAQEAAEAGNCHDAKSGLSRGKAAMDSDYRIKGRKDVKAAYVETLEAVVGCDK